MKWSRNSSVLRYVIRVKDWLQVNKLIKDNVNADYLFI